MLDGVDPDQLFRPQEAASLLGLTVRCLENWRRAGEGPPFVRISHRAVRYRRSDLRRWLAGRMRGSNGGERCSRPESEDDARVSGGGEIGGM